MSRRCTQQLARAAFFMGSLSWPKSDIGGRWPLGLGGHMCCAGDLADLAYIEPKAVKAKRLLDSASAADPAVGSAICTSRADAAPPPEFRNAWVNAELAARLGYPIPGTASSILVWARMPDSAATHARADSLAQGGAPFAHGVAGVRRPVCGCCPSSR